MIVVYLIIGFLFVVPVFLSLLLVATHVREKIERDCELARMKLEAEEERKYCVNCYARLDLKNDNYHIRWGACNRYCYAENVGVNLHEFNL